MCQNGAISILSNSMPGKKFYPIYIDFFTYDHQIQISLFVHSYGNGIGVVFNHYAFNATGYFMLVSQIFALVGILVYL